jgi:hypothetical protein
MFVAIVWMDVWLRFDLECDWLLSDVSSIRSEA